MILHLFSLFISLLGIDLFFTFCLIGKSLIGGRDDDNAVRQVSF